MDERISTLYETRREVGRVLILPSSVFAGLMVGMFAAGSGFTIYLSTLFFRRVGEVSADLWFGLFFLLVAGYSGVPAVRAWRTRRTPLCIEDGGRVLYGAQLLCAAGSVRSVRIAEAKGGEGDCEVFLELGGGELVPIPSLYFPRLNSRTSAGPLAVVLAEALRVQVSESR